MLRGSYQITGMGCASCAKHVKSAVTVLNGVKNCEVDLQSETMTVDFDEDAVSFEDIKEAVEEAGYGLAK
jgi:copper ion binding protein